MGPPLDEELNPIAFPILHVLPPLVVRTLQKHFYAGVKAAEMRFKYNAADEDSLTGALGERLTEPKPIVIRSGNDVLSGALRRTRSADVVRGLRSMNSAQTGSFS